MYEQQPLAELAVRQHLADAARRARASHMSPPRRPHGHRRRVMADRLRRVADRLDS